MAAPDGSRAFGHGLVGASRRQLPEVREPDGGPAPAPGPDAPIVRVPRGNAAVSLALRRAVHVRARTAGILNPMSRAEASVIRTAELDRGRSTS